MPSSNGQYRLSELSARFGLELRGDGEHRVDGVGTLADAGPSQLTFLANRAYAPQLPSTRAGAVILAEADAEACPTHALIADDPYLAYARIATLFDPRPAPVPGVHASAVVAESARLGSAVSVGANAIVGPDCQIGDGSTIGPGCVLEAGVQLGEGCRLHANVSLGHGVRLGKRVIVHPGAVIGADGFGIAFAGDHWEKVPQLGTVVVGDDCEIGANACIDRGAIDDTVLEEDVRIDNLCQIAHNVHIGAHTAMAAASCIAGSARIGRYCLLAGDARVNGHIEVADRTTVTGGSYLMRSVSEPGQSWSSMLPARPTREWQRNAARLNRLDELTRTVQKLKKATGNPTEDD